MLSRLLFLISINDLHLAIEYSEVHHVAADTNLVNFNIPLTHFSPVSRFYIPSNVRRVGIEM